MGEGGWTAWRADALAISHPLPMPWRAHAGAAGRVGAAARPGGGGAFLLPEVRWHSSTFDEEGTCVIPPVLLRGRRRGGRAACRRGPARQRRCRAAEVRGVVRRRVVATDRRECEERRPGGDPASSTSGRDGVATLQGALDDQRFRRLRVAGHDWEHACAAHRSGRAIFDRECERRGSRAWRGAGAHVWV